MVLFIVGDKGSKLIFMCDPTSEERDVEVPQWFDVVYPEDNMGKSLW